MDQKPDNDNYDDNDNKCPICTQPAPGKERHRRHYGGVCCNSCRSFFLRAHQKTMQPKFTCNYGE
jgi:hypothetical protein